VAVVVGNNAGTGEVPPLRYAEADAGKVARVLVELGQVSPEDLYLLQGRPLLELEKVLQLLTARVAEIHRAPDARAVLIFFFSGHSDGEALELGSDRLPFGQLKGLLSATGAEVRLSFIDACRSGAAIQAKGGKPAPPFAIRLTDDLSSTGDAMLTSSAADEIALESKEVMGSYFTHHLVSGLRGAADTSGDGLVTLAEAYRYAYDHTLSATSATLGGAQHPAYDFRLSGQGELVLTVLQRASAGLELPAGLERALVTDVTRDQVVAEVMGGARLVALTPGTYGVRAFKGGRPLGNRFTLVEGQIRSVGLDELKPMDAPVVARKGELPAPATASTAARAQSPGFTGVSLGFGTSKAIAHGVPWIYALRFSWDALRWVRLSVIGSLGTANGGDFGEYAMHVRAGFHFSPQAGPVQFLIGLDAGPGVIWQTASGQTPAWTFAFAAGPRLGLRFEVTPSFFMALEGEVMFGVGKIDGDAGFLFMPGGMLSAGLRL
jgi:hypothetical protein